MNQNFFQVDHSVSLKKFRYAKGQVRLGLCCINNTLSKTKKISVNNSCIRKTYTPERAIELATKNVSNILPILKWNHEHNIRHYRLSSDMFPHFTDPEVERYTPTQEIIDILRATGEYVTENNHRITMHPGQYNQIAAKDKGTWEKTVDDLTHHAWILDTMNINDNGIICIHGGGVYGDKESTMRRWVDQFDDLPRSVKNRLAIENCEHCYYVRDCLNLAQECNIPMIYDSHHYYCYRHIHPDQELESIDDMMPEIVESWKYKIPLFHISDQAQDEEGNVSRIGAHHDYINEIPGHLLSVCHDYNTPIDIEVEAKAKEDAIFRLHKKYNYIFG